MARARPTIRRFADLDALSEAAATELTALARAAIAERGSFHVALSGGSTPRRLFERLAAAGPGALPWADVHLWWGDERTVPPDHADSNYAMARRALIEPLGLADARIHRIAGEDPDPVVAALAYERALVAALGAPPVFDLVLLGMGPDGHTASLFPGSPAVDGRIDQSKWVVANPVRSPLVHGEATRITLTAPAINAARHVRFLVTGADKAAVLAQVLEGAHDPERYPSQLIAPAELAWLVDTAAAAALQEAA